MSALLRQRIVQRMEERTCNIAIVTWISDTTSLSPTVILFSYLTIRLSWINVLSESTSSTTSIWPWKRKIAVKSLLARRMIESRISLSFPTFQQYVITRTWRKTAFETTLTSSASSKTQESLLLSPKIPVCITPNNTYIITSSFSPFQKWAIPVSFTTRQFYNLVWSFPSPTSQTSFLYMRPIPIPASFFPRISMDNMPMFWTLTLTTFSSATPEQVDTSLHTSGT